MRLSEADRQAIVEEARDAGIGEVYVFGSVLADHGEPQDIDVAVDAVPPGALFRFYAALSRRLSKRLGVVDLGQRNPVSELIAAEAVRLDG